MSFENEVVAAEKTYQEVIEPTENPVKLGFFSSKRKEWLDLLQDGNTSVTIDDKAIKYEFKAPYLVHQIQLVGNDAIKAGNLKLEIQENDGKWTTLNLTDTDNDSTLNYDFSKFLTALRVSCPKASGLNFWSKEKLAGISLRGWTYEEAMKIEQTAESFFTIKTALESSFDTYNKKIQNDKAALEQKKTEVEAKVSAMNASLEEKKVSLEHIVEEIKEKSEALKNLEVAFASTTLSSSNLEAEVEKADQKHKSLLQDTLNLESKIQERSEELRINNVEIAAKKSELTDLHKDVSLFADNIKGLAQQGTSQVNTYFKFVIVPAMILIAAITAWSIDSTIKLAEQFSKYPDRLEGLLVIRCFTLLFAVSGFIVIYKIMFPFVRNIIDIHQRRIRISEITMLSRDFTDSAADDEELSDDERLDLNMKTRMTLIREYLTGKYDPSATRNMSFGLTTLIGGALASKFIGVPTVATTLLASHTANNKGESQKD